MAQTYLCLGFSTYRGIRATCVISDVAQQCSGGNDTLILAFSG